METVADEKGSCLKKSEESDAVYLDSDHAYYYQTQTRMSLCKVEYCDLCVCTFPPGSDPQIHIEWLSPDPDLWIFCLDASTCFFKKMLLPELLGNGTLEYLSVGKQHLTVSNQMAKMQPQMVQFKQQGRILLQAFLQTGVSTATVNNLKIILLR